MRGTGGRVRSPLEVVLDAPLELHPSLLEVADPVVQSFLRSPGIRHGYPVTEAGVDDGVPRAPETLLTFVRHTTDGVKGLFTSKFSVWTGPCEN